MKKISIKGLFIPIPIFLVLYFIFPYLENFKLHYGLGKFNISIMLLVLFIGYAAYLNSVLLRKAMSAWLKRDITWKQYTVVSLISSLFYSILTSFLFVPYLSIKDALQEFYIYLITFALAIAFPVGIYGLYLVARLVIKYKLSKGFPWSVFLSSIFLALIGLFAFINLIDVLIAGGINF